MPTGLIPRSASACTKQQSELEFHELNIRSSAAMQHNQTDLDFDSEEVGEQLAADMIMHVSLSMNHLFLKQTSCRCIM